MTDAALRTRMTARSADLARRAAEAERAAYDWPSRARAEQLAPPWDWRTWLLLAGRGFGKTRTIAEWVRHMAESGGARRIALVARTAADARDVLVSGESGILAVSPPSCRPDYKPSLRRLTWPNGAIATTYSADEPDLLRGPQHDAAACDELAAWKYPDAWDQLRLGLRLGARPQCAVATTPRPTPIIRALVAEASAPSPTVHVTRGSTYDNRANLAPAFLEQVVARYEGTRLGRQELLAEILDDAPAALWRRDQIDALRVRTAPELRRIVVAIDPAVSSSEKADETGIVVAGIAANGHIYILADLSGRYSPDGWARAAIGAYRNARADRIVAEVNNGGEMVEMTLRTVDRMIPYTAVHASRGKRVRAEPVAALTEQGKIHHVGMLAELEDQLCTWDAAAGGKSPDRLDAMVWACASLMPSGHAPSGRAFRDLDERF
jgi:phage terminase large subunit-like protein